MTNNKYCTNCGKYGHIYKSCNQPITSIGILCFKLTKNLNINYKDIEKYISKKYINIDNYNFRHIDNLLKIDFLKNKIKFLLVRRKHTLNYIEFIRGKYNYNDLEKLVNMFELMTPEEIDKINKNNFEYLWKNLWNKTYNCKLYQKEYLKSKNKFNRLKKNKKLEKLVKIQPLYNTPEWGIPKGKRNNQESNINCAIREFYEETNIKKSDYIILNNLYSLEEKYKGTNGKEYKHMYYLSISNSDLKIPDIYETNYEIGDIGWFTWEETIKLFRSYYKSKIELINKVFILLSNIIFEFNDYNNKSINI